MADRPTASTVTDAQLDALYAELEQLRADLESCRRHNLAAVDRGIRAEARAERAEQQLAQVRQLAVEMRDWHDTPHPTHRYGQRVLAALDGGQPARLTEGDRPMSEPMSEPLPPFSGDTPTCTQCGHRGASTDYQPHGTCLHPTGHVMGYGPNPRLHRECQRCGHMWDEATVQRPREDDQTGASRPETGRDGEEPGDTRDR